MDQKLEFEKKYDVKLENLFEGFQVISFDFRYLYLNDAIVEQSKYSREELLGHTMMEKYPGIEKTDFFRTLQRCMRERISKHFENEFTFPDGSVRWFDLLIHPIPDGVYILSVDITERKRAERKKQEYIDNLEQMIDITSHKVRQPVAHILGISNLLNETKPTIEDLSTMVNYIRESASSLDNFTRELTHFIQELKEKTEDASLV